MENRLMTIAFIDMQGYTKRSASQTIEEMKLFHDQMFKLNLSEHERRTIRDIQQLFNEKQLNRAEILCGEMVYRVGDMRGSDNENQGAHCALVKAHCALVKAHKKAGAEAGFFMQV